MVRSPDPFVTAGQPIPSPATGTEFDSLVTRLADVATMAFHGVPGCDAAGITLRLDAGTVTMGATSSAAHDLDAVQQQLGDGPCPTALQQGQVVLVDDYDTDLRWPLVRQAAAGHGIRSTMSLPLLSEGLVLGVLSLHAHHPRAFGSWARHVAGVLARQAAGAISDVERTRRVQVELAAQQRIAQALRQDLVPIVLPVPGIVTASRYAAADRGVDVGGDWFDVFPLPNQEIGIAIGDVMGHGIGVANAMSQLRTALRSYAYDGRSPADVLDRLDRLVQGSELPLTTGVYGALTLQEGGALLRYSNAGHPPPMVRCPDGRVQPLDQGASWLLGGPTHQLGPRSGAAVWLPSGSTLVLYTDGLVEHRRHRLEDGIDLLRLALSDAEPGATPEALCDLLLGAARHTDDADDVALLVVSVC